MKNWKEEITQIINSAKTKIADIDFSQGTISYSEKITSHEKITLLRKSDSKENDEEYVRAYLTNKLVNELGYIEKNIEFEKTYTQSSIGRDKANKNFGQVDIIVKDKSGNPFLFIECKAPDKFEEGKTDIRGQLFNLSDEEEKQFKTKVQYLVYYTVDHIDGKFIDNLIIIDKTVTPTYEDWEAKNLSSMSNELPYNYGKPPRKIRVKNAEDKDLISISKERLSQIRTQIHNTLWSSGVEDNEAYNFLIKFLLTKIYDEDFAKPNQEYKCQIFDKDYEDDQAFLKRMNDTYKSALKDKLNYNEKDLDSNSIISNSITIKSLYFMTELLENYSFRKSLSQKEDILGLFFEETNRDKFKQSKGQFFTTNNVVKFIIYGLQLDELAKSLFDKHRLLPYIIDPSTGSGTFLIESMKAITKTFKDHTITANLSYEENRIYKKYFPEDKPNDWAQDFIYGIDNAYNLALSTKVNMILHGDGSSHIFLNDGLASFDRYQDLKGTKLEEREEAEAHYLKNYPADTHMLVNERFNVVMSNPPFSINPTSSKEDLNKYFLFGDGKSENLFIERYYQLLQEGGRLGVVLPESTFDTTEHTYIRLFLYKYFNIKAVVSLPQITFEPYTSTKTSVLFAQKKTRLEVEHWNGLWQVYSNEWGKLKTRVNRYYDFFVKGEKLNKRTAFAKELSKETRELFEQNDNEAIEEIKKEDKEHILQNIKRFLKDYVTANDDELEIKELLEKYSSEIADLSEYDKKTTHAFGFVNAWWVFGEVAKELDYEIFMAQADNVGYKRTSRGENPMPNDLFDLEYAPTELDVDGILNKYADRILLISNKITATTEEQKKLVAKAEKSEKEKKRIDELQQKLNGLCITQESIEKELDQISVFTEKYYKESKLKDEYLDRTDCTLTDFFKKGLLKEYCSREVLLRTKEQLTILDALRQEVVWG